MQVFQSILAILLPALVVFVLAAVGAQSRPDHRGWRQIKPGPMHWAGLVLGGCLTLFMAYIWLFVGSSRPDAENQMAILFWLMLAFGTGTLCVGVQTWLIGKRNVRWRGKSIRWAGQSQDSPFTFSDVSDVRLTSWGGAAIEFGPGRALKIDPNALGARSLLDAVASDLETRHGPR